MYNNYPNGNPNPGYNQYGGQPNYNNMGSVPSYYKPISAWGYIGYMLLYSIPLVGFIMLIVNALNTDNINKRNFARSYLWLILISFILWLVIFIGAVIVGVIANGAQ